MDLLEALGKVEGKRGRERSIPDKEKKTYQELKVSALNKDGWRLLYRLSTLTDMIYT